MSGSTPGTFYGIGAGPGDPELLTLKAVRLLGAVSRIFYPASARREESVAGRIIAPLGIPEQKLRRVSLYMARERSDDVAMYGQVATEIVVELGRGASVAWISEGDPLFYGSFVHVRDEVLRQAPAARIEIVPGVTSVQAAAARAGIPVAHLDDKVAILPASYGLEHLPEMLERFATIFLLKVHTALEQLLAVLGKMHVPVQAVYLEHIGSARERIVTDLGSLRGERLPYFSLVILRRTGKEQR